MSSAVPLGQRRSHLGLVPKGTRRINRIIVPTAGHPETTHTNDSARKLGRPVLYLVTKPTDVRPWRWDPGQQANSAVASVALMEPSILDVFEGQPLLSEGNSIGDLFLKRIAAADTNETGLLCDDDMKPNLATLDRLEKGIARYPLASCRSTMRSKRGAIPDKSAVHLVDWLLGGRSTEFFSGNCLAFDSHGWNPAFPPFYSEDWAVLEENNWQVANCGTVVQSDRDVGINGVMTPERSAPQEPTDTYFEGLYAMRAAGLDPEDPQNWQRFIGSRRAFLRRLERRVAEHERGGRPPTSQMRAFSVTESWRVAPDNMVYEKLLERMRLTVHAAQEVQKDFRPEYFIGLHRSLREFRATIADLRQDHVPLASVKFHYIGRSFEMPQDTSWHSANSRDDNAEWFRSIQDVAPMQRAAMICRRACRSVGLDWDRITWQGHDARPMTPGTRNALLARVENVYLPIALGLVDASIGGSHRPGDVQMLVDEASAFAGSKPSGEFVQDMYHDPLHWKIKREIAMGREALGSDSIAGDAVPLMAVAM